MCGFSPNSSMRFCAEGKLARLPQLEIYNSLSAKIPLWGAWEGAWHFSCWFFAHHYYSHTASANASSSRNFTASGRMRATSAPTHTFHARISWSSIRLRLTSHRKGRGLRVRPSRMAIISAPRFRQLWLRSFQLRQPPLILPRHRCLRLRKRKKPRIRLPLQPKMLQKAYSARRRRLYCKCKCMASTPSRICR